MKDLERLGQIASGFAKITTAEFNASVPFWQERDYKKDDYQLAEEVVITYFFQSLSLTT